MITLYNKLYIVASCWTIIDIILSIYTNVLPLSYRAHFKKVIV